MTEPEQNIWEEPQNGTPSEAEPQSFTDSSQESGVTPPPASPSCGSSPYCRPYFEPNPTPAPKHKGARVVLIVAAVIVVILATAFVFAEKSHVRFDSPRFPGEEVTPPKPETVSEEDSEETLPVSPTADGTTLTLGSLPKGSELTLPEIYQKNLDSVIAIKAKTGSGFSWGSGVIFTENGYIVTNEHIIDGASAVTVLLSDDRTFDAVLIGKDTISDLAVLKIEAENLSPAEFGNSEHVCVGDRVVAIGNPLGEDFRGTMTDGIISAIDRDVTYNNHSMTLLQTNAAINEGNSGGPLINLYGQVIGITNMKMMSDYSSIDGIGFAIPSTTLKTVVEQLIATGAVSGRPGIGITVSELRDSVASYYDLPSGLYVSEVVETSDAYAQGLRDGDIILSVEGESVSTANDITAVIEGYAVGDSVTLAVYRDGEELTITCRLMELSELFE